MKSRLTPVARSLRKKMTDAELSLWRTLRGRQLEGLKFRRQQPFGPFIVDFVSFERRLIIEADGSQHYYGDQKKKDLKRDMWLQEQGFKVLRFNDNEILTNVNGVVERILQCI